MNTMFRSVLASFLALLLTVPAYGQSTQKTPEDRPRLVVGIVVDQMRYEFIPRFWSKFGDDGFKRLVNEGYSFTNHHFNYFPTYTGPGHAAVYTGTTPSVNGIVGNSWYERTTQSGMYVVSDTTVQTVGSDGDLGRMSPTNLRSSTVTDELKQAIPESKVVAFSIKDRGAVLPAGHLGDGAFWYDDQTGHFVSSTWYADELPNWLQEFNESGLAEELSNQTWTPKLQISQYKTSNPDNSPYEATYGDKEEPVFPHRMNGSFGNIESSPFGNTLTSEAAKAAVEGEDLGADAATDFLAISFSSTDYVGHQYGPNSIEVADTYLRLDETIADMLTYLDQKVGKGNYLVFLTADHGVVDVPAYLKDKGMPGGYFDSDTALDSLQAFLNNKYGEASWIEDYTNQQVYLRRDVVKQHDIVLEEIQQDAAQFLQQFEGIASTNTAHNFETQAYSEGLQAMYQRGHYAQRSGDVYIQLAPGWLDRTSKTGNHPRLTLHL